jgi:CBS domain-containing protein
MQQPVKAIVAHGVPDGEPQEVGDLVDVVAASTESPYPPVVAMVLRVGNRRVRLEANWVERIDANGVLLKSLPEDLPEFSRHQGELLLAKDLLDRQLVDVEGVSVVRATDLYLAPLLGRMCLVGTGDHGWWSRYWPRRFSRRRNGSGHGRIIDWASIEAFPAPDADDGIRIQVAHRGLRRLTPAELADLLEKLDRLGRMELLDNLRPEKAADALEEMEPDKLAALLREASADKAASLIGSMEQDEAAEALRDLDPEEQEAILEHLPARSAESISKLLAYPEVLAGGFMNPMVVEVSPDDTVEQVRQKLVGLGDHRHDIDAVAVVEDGQLIGDVPLFDLVVASANTRMDELITEEAPTTVDVDAPVNEVLERLVDSRASSVVVVDENNKPVGRVMADDLIDSLRQGLRRFYVPRFLR